MGLASVTRAGVLAAARESERLGRDEFRRRYDFGRATTYELVLDGYRHDSKAIAGVAHLYSADALLTAQDFSGGAHTVVRHLRALGFTVEERGQSSQDSAAPATPGLVLQPRGGTRDRGPHNFAKSVRRGVPLSSLRDVLGGESEVLAGLYPNGIARFWGSTPTSQTGNAKAKALRGRRVGDDVLFYADNSFIARARILHLFTSPAVARAVWGTDDESATWEHIMALGEIEEFAQPVSALEVLAALNVPAPLRSLTLRSAHDYHHISPMLPGPRRRPASPAPEPPPAAPTPMEPANLLARLDGLKTHHAAGGGRPSRHQPIALLWSIARVAAGKPRLAPWSRFRAEVGPLLAEFGLPHSKVTPEYPFWHLRGSGLWEVHGVSAEPGSAPQVGTLNSAQPVAGLSFEAAELLRNPVVRLEAMARLVAGYLQDVDRTALLCRLGLPEYTTADGLLERTGDPDERGARETDRTTGATERRASTTLRPIRDAALASRVKRLHGHQCQVCGIQLRYLLKPYNEAAHIRGLGSPHDGPDELRNLLCLCPNHHVLFDGLEIYVDAEGRVRQSRTGQSLGLLQLHPDHPIDQEHLRYHRTLCELNA
ncbi:HNH endonuclease [Kitasatospora sp. NBC_00315]|uniref:HNH endonuclease n=1 Tax=Kitasatospora sp. NBC_00315 TaxID=2975963 RepID=UPI003243357E